MKTYEITSLTNERIKTWTKLHQTKYRRETGQFLIEGQHLIEEAQQAGLIETLARATQAAHDRGRSGRRRAPRLGRGADT